MSRRRLDRVLQSQGFGSRKECRALIERGAVSIAGVAMRDWRVEVPVVGLALDVCGTTWTFRETVHLALHKPAGYECSREPTHHRSVLELLPEPYARRGVQPVGRLDQDTTGLLLLSDDGAFIHAHGAASRKQRKTYVARTREPVSEELVRALLDGVRLRAADEVVCALACRRLGPDRIELTLDQGKYHQVRRMIAAAGHHCVELHRSAVGALRLEELGLAPGEWVVLDDAALRRLSADA